MFDTLKDILVSKLKVPHEQVTPESTAEEAELDSLAIVELSMILEKELNVHITEDELSEAETIGEIARLMEERSVKI
ncbi:acyl carrier protein [Streptomyces sp. NPDC005065]|uniref:acyl carrier protein n=1 Tax=unclassified Streptomyces TaxID=2593676 RepID=UPI0033B02848